MMLHFHHQFMWILRILAALRSWLNILGDLNSVLFVRALVVVIRIAQIQRKFGDLSSQRKNMMPLYDLLNLSLLNLSIKLRPRL